MIIGREGAAKVVLTREDLFRPIPHRGNTLRTIMNDLLLLGYNETATSTLGEFKTPPPSRQS